MAITLEKKIGNGVHREAHTLRGRARRIAKVTRDYFVLKVLTFLRRGSVDINVDEYEIYKALPDELCPYLMQNVSLTTTDDGRSALVSDRAVNYDGTFSETLEKHGKVKNAAFWKHWNSMVTICKRHDVRFFDVFKNPGNIVIQKISESEWKPVIIDVKSRDTTNIYLKSLPALFSRVYAWRKILRGARKTRREYS